MKNIRKEESKCVWFTFWEIINFGKQWNFSYWFPPPYKTIKTKVKQIGWKLYLFPIFIMCERVKRKCILLCFDKIAIIYAGQRLQSNSKSDFINKQKKQMDNENTVEVFQYLHIMRIHTFLIISNDDIILFKQQFIVFRCCFLFNFFLKYQLFKKWFSKYEKSNPNYFNSKSRARQTFESILHCTV